MMLAWYFSLAVGQFFIYPGSGLPPPPKGNPDACPPGMAVVAAGIWVAEGKLNRQANSFAMRAGPWQTTGEQCEVCPRTLPTTCVADYQGMETIRSASGPVKLHVFGQTHWLPAMRWRSQ